MTDIALIPVPFSQDKFREGMGQAPDALLAPKSRLMERLRAKSIKVASTEILRGGLGEGDMLARLGRLQAAVAQSVTEALEHEHLPVILGGDCCNAIGAWSGITRARPGLTIGVVWLDAHGDWNTEETTLSGYIGGMPYAAICGYGNAGLRQAVGLTNVAATERCSLLGVRDLDPPEKVLLDTTKVAVLTTEQVRQELAPAMRALAGVDAFYLHFDIDVLDVRKAPGVNYPVPGGLSSDEAIRMARDLIATKPMLAFSLTAIDPTRDPSGQTVETGIKVLVEILEEAGRKSHKLWLGAASA